MTLPNPLRITRALMSRMNSLNPKPQTMSSLDSLRVQAKPSLDLKIDTQQIIASVFKQSVTVIIPTLNEAEAIREVIEEVRAEGYNNIVVVDGYSTDRTDGIAFGNGVRLVYQHGIGKAGGVKTALEFAKTPFVLFMDGDGTYDPKDIWRLVNHTDHYSHVIGARNRRNIDRVHRFGNSLISHLFSLLFGTKVSDVCSGMYLLETDIARSYNLEEPGFVAEIELAAQSASRQELAEVPVNYRPRIGTRKLDTWRDGQAILSAAFKLAWKHNPLLLCSGLAGLLVVPALLTLSWVILEYLRKGIWLLGWALLGTILLVMGTQALTLAGMSLLTKNAERRLAQEIRTHTVT